MSWQAQGASPLPSLLPAAQAAPTHRLLCPCAVPLPLTVLGCAMLCHASGVVGVFPAHWVSGEGTALPQLNLGPGRRWPGVLQAEIHLWNT